MSPPSGGRRGSQVKGHNASEEAGDREGQPGNGQFNPGRAERGDGPGRAHVRHPGLLGRTPGAVPGTAQGDRSPWRRGRGRKPFSRHRSDAGRSLCDLQSPRVARGVWLTRKFLPGLQCAPLCRPDRQTAAGSGPGRVCPTEPEDAEPPRRQTSVRSQAGRLQAAGAAAFAPHGTRSGRRRLTCLYPSFLPRGTELTTVPTGNDSITGTTSRANVGGH